MQKVNREQIMKILRDNITFSHQVEGYVVHGAIDKLADLINEYRKEALEEADKEIDEAFIGMPYETACTNITSGVILRLKDKCI